jgi:hypothetical protein
MRRIAFSVLSEGLPTGAGLVWESMIGLEFIAAMSFNVNECACATPTTIPISGIFSTTRLPIHVMVHYFTRSLKVNS